MWRKWIIRIIFSCFILFILIYTYQVGKYYKISTGSFYFITNNQRYNPSDFINLGFSLFEFEQAKLREIQLGHEYDLTGVLLHWKRLEGIQKTLKHFLETNLFEEIIVWNNNPEINLTVHDLIKNNHSTKFIRIINSKENLKDAAKYRACSEARTRACFYADDDWNISHYTKSLIASFRSDPNVLHSVTDSYTFYTNLIWSYFDPTIDLHTGFSWIGCGSIFLREHAQRHLQLLNKYLINDSALAGLSDVFFSIWLNDIPSQMNTDIRHQPSASSGGSLPFSSTPRFSELQYRSSVLAIRILEHSLRFDRSNTNNLTFPRQQNRRFLYDVRSPSFNDDFIFYSNILPFEMQNISFNITRDFERGTRRNLPRGANVSYFTSHSTWKAVDDHLTTCWHSNRPLHSGDFFAIDFLRVQTNITFMLAVSHSQILQQNLDIRISFDGSWWIPYRSLNGIFTKIDKTLEKEFYITLFDSSLFNPGFQSFRYISFKTNTNSDEHFQVCRIQIISKKDIINIIHDYHQLSI